MSKMCSLTVRGLATILVVVLTCLGRARSSSGKPEIIERPKSQRVHVNQSATFVCRVKSGSPLIMWMKGEEVISNLPGSILLANNSLIFSKVQKGHAGVYKCIAKNNVGVSSAEATLTVLDPLVAPAIVRMSTNETIREGQSITFTCKATGNPSPLIKWMILLPHTANPQVERPSPDAIRIQSVTPRDSGQYTCIAVNEKGNDTRSLFLKVLGYPVFIESPPLNITVSENATVSLNCRVTGSPFPDVMWYYGNQPVAQFKNVVVLPNNTLVIRSVIFKNRGIYTCAANNTAGLHRSKSTLLLVRRRPRLLSSPDSVILKNETAIAGESKSLNCSATGHPKPEYNWSFNNKTVSRKPVFIIPVVSNTSEGFYFCKAFNSLGSLLIKIFLSVSVLPNVSVIPERKVALPGDSVEFMCVATGDPLLEMIWYSSRGKISRNDTLVLTNVSVSAGGEYRCVARNSAGMNWAKGTLVVAVSPMFEIKPPRNVTGNEGSVISIRCTAKGPDEPVINWYRIADDGKKILLKASEKISLYSGVLNISKLARDDGGSYSCDAKNHAGRISSSFFINILYRPYLILSDQNISVIAGSEVKIYCPIEANPTAQIQWVQPVRSDKNYLLIASVDSSHGGKYVCTGVNLLGTLQAIVEVTVLSPPQIIALKKVEKQNNWLLLTCETQGVPKPLVQWINHTPNLPSGSFTVHLETLYIDKRFVNIMEFECNASNAYGWMSKNVGIPTSPHNVSVTKTTSSYVNFSWIANSKDVISRFVVERFSKSGSSWILVNSSVQSSWIRDDGLPPYSWFLFRVIAVNILGQSDPSEFLNVTTLEGVPSPPTGLALASRELTSVTVVWKPPGKPNGPLTNIIYELLYMKHGSSIGPEVKMNSSNTGTYRLTIENLKSNTLYIIQLRAGRKCSNAVMYWSDYASIGMKTLQQAPKVSPKLKKAVSNGPRRIFVSWERSVDQVDGYDVGYKKYESPNITTVSIEGWNTSNYMIKGLTENTYYEVLLRMFTSGGSGPWSIPVVIQTDPDKIALSGPIPNSSDGLPWKIAVGGAALGLVLLSLLIFYMYLVRKSKMNDGSEGKEKKSRNRNRYNFDSASRVSNESEGSIAGIYNVNVDDNIDLAMFDHSRHSGASDGASNMYVENPILPADQMESDDSYEAVRLATFTTRTSPHPSPHGSPNLTGRQPLPSVEMNPIYGSELPLYSTVNDAAQARQRKATDNTTDEISDDMLI